MARMALGTTSFFYLAAKPDGGRTMGMMRAESRRQLSDHLRKQRLVTLRTWQMPTWVGGDEKINLKDQGELHTQLAQLLTRGVPLVEALETTADAVAPTTRGRVTKLRDLVAAGSGFADACQKVDVFDPVTISVYRAAERTGDLGGAAKQLAATTRRQIRITEKVRTLMAYPAIVASISLIIAVFMLTVVVPMIGKSLLSMGAELPWVTRAMIATGSFIRDHALLVLLGAIVVVTLLVFARRPIIAAFAKVTRNLPIVRDVVLTQESARFFTVMAAMTRSGVVLADALGVATNAISHPLLRKQLVTLRTRLIEGGILRALIDSVTALPLPTRRLLIAAERSGDMETAFELLAADMTDELERQSQRLLAVLEPLLIVGLFIVIGSMLLAIMIPLIQATSRAGFGG